MKYIMLLLGLSVLILGPAAVLAGPSLPVTKPPVMNATILTGPPRDAPAVTGQWFRSSSSGIETVRTHEFYDELLGGGSGSAAIAGFVSSITYDIASNITAFSIIATMLAARLMANSAAFSAANRNALLKYGGLSRLSGQ